MVAAIFYLDGWMGYQEFFIEGSSASELLFQFDKIQDLACLSRMGRTQGTANDCMELAKLDSVLDKYYNNELKIEDLKGFQIEISIGKFGVKDISKEKTVISKMRNECK